MSSIDPREEAGRQDACGHGKNVAAARSRSIWLLLLLMVVGGCRQDMHDQPRYKPYRVFDDREIPRAPVEGTIARGQLKEDVLFYTGKLAAASGDKQGSPPVYAGKLPMPLNQELLDRGEERFNISCSPCHGRIGDGDGMIVRRGFRRPPSFHIDRLRNMPVGYIFDVVTNGFGAMPDYSTQISPGDRWAIVAYVRALQLSQHATLNDVPAEGRRELGLR